MPIDVVIKKTRENAEEFYKITMEKDELPPEEG